MDIEELAFKPYYELKDIPKIDLLLIIEFLQKDREEWINQFSKTHNDHVYIQLRINKAINFIEKWLKEYDELLEILKGGPNGKTPDVVIVDEFITDKGGPNE